MIIPVRDYKRDTLLAYWPTDKPPIPNVGDELEIDNKLWVVLSRTFNSTVDQITLRVKQRN